MSDKKFNVVKACDEVLKMLHKKANDLEKKLNEAKDERSQHLTCFVVYKDYELYTYEDIQALYGNGEISEKKFESLAQELEDKVSGNDIVNKVEILEYELKFINHFIRDMEGTKECELQKLGWTDEQINKMRLNIKKKYY